MSRNHLVKSIPRLLLALWLAIGPAWAGTLPLLGVGKTGAAAAFQGPGDVLASNSLTGLIAYGCGQAYSAATRGSKTCKVCDLTGGTVGTCADLLSDATTGIVVPQTIGAVTCPGNATLCGVQTFYDKIGTACSGACDVSTNGAASTYAILKPNALSTNACAAFVGGTTNYNVRPTLSGSTAQPWTMTIIANRTSGTAQSGVIGDSTGNSVGFNGAANQTQLYAGGGSQISQSGVTDAQPHAIQGYANGASSYIYTDGVASTPANPGTASISSNVFLGQDQFSNVFTGLMCGDLAYSGTAGNLTGSQSFLNTLIHSNWGF